MADNVHKLSTYADIMELRRQLASGGGPPDNGDMEKRLSHLEKLVEQSTTGLNAIELRLTKIEAKQDEFARHFATKADVTSAKNSIITWVVSAIFLAQLLPLVADFLKKL